MTTTAAIKRVIARDGGLCVIAGRYCAGDAVTADHRANRGSGGSVVLDNPSNLIAACVICNGQKEDADGAYRAELIERGVRVVKASTNEATVVRCQLTKVRYPDGSEWWLTTDFRRTPSSVPQF